MVTSLPASPSLEVTKTASVTDNGDGVTGIGDIIRYTINVKNTGNISLSGLTLTDNLSDVTGGSLSLSSGPSFSGSDQGSSQGSLKVSETATYIAFYIVEQSVIDAGGVSNQAIATASTPQSVPVTDTSDDPTTGAANDPTVTTITGSPSIEVTKTATVLSLIHI